MVVTDTRFLDNSEQTRHRIGANTAAIVEKSSSNEIDLFIF